MRTEIYKHLFDGVVKRRTFQRALTMKTFLEEGMIIEPVYWIGLTFKNGVLQEKARDCLVDYFQRVTNKILKLHVQPIVVWNTDNNRVKNDLHVVLLPIVTGKPIQ